MSHVTLSPAVLQRVESFAAEVADTCELAGYLHEFFCRGIPCASLDHVRASLDQSHVMLVEALGGEEDEDLDRLPLSRTEPYFLPMALERIATVASQWSPVVLAFAVSASENEYLALDYFAVLLRETGVTAGHLCATIREELPPSPAQAPVTSRAVTA